MLPNGKRPTADMATAGEQVRQVIEDEQAQIQYLKPAGARSSSCMNNERFSAAHVNNWSQKDEWATQVDAKGDITLKITFEQKVCVLGMSLGHGTQGREFTCVPVSGGNKNQNGNQIDLPPTTAETRDFTTWFQLPVEGREIVLTFNMNSVIGDRGAPGLAYVASSDMGLEPEMFSLKALLLGFLHCFHVCDFFNPQLPQGMNIETLRRVGATLCLLLTPVGYSRKRLQTPRALHVPLYLIACHAHAELALGTAIS